MAVYSIGLVAHAGAGKTSLAEAMLHTSGVLKKMGQVPAGTAALDWEPEEKERQSSVNSALAHVEWGGHQVHLLDTPGSMNFVGQTVAAFRAIDGALLLASAEPGVHSQTEFLWEQMEKLAIPRMLVVSQMDREQADFFARVEALNEIFGGRLLPVVLPLGTAERFTGVVDLVNQRAYDYSDPAKPREMDIPETMGPQVEDYRARLVETVAEADDDLLEKYLETEALDDDDIRRGLQAGTRAGQFVPVLCTAATRNIATDRILDAATAYLPDFEARMARRREHESVEGGYVPDCFENEDFAALVFKSKIDHYAGKLSIVRVFSGELKAGMDVFNPATGATERPAHLFRLQGKEQQEVQTLQAGELGALPKLQDTHVSNTLCSPRNKVEFAPIAFPQPVLTYALALSGKGEEDKLASALQRMMEEDPTLEYHHNTETGDFLVSGMGQIHLDMVLARLKREYSITAQFSLPHVPYRETIRGEAKSQGKYKKQTGGRGQYGDCWLEIKPTDLGETLNFHSAIVGGVIPKTYIPAIEKGVQEAMHKGVVAGYPVIGVDCTVYDGSYHDVDSSEMAFKIAGSMAFKKAMEQARPVLLEPVMHLEIIVHADYMGDVMGDINSRRGRVQGMDAHGRNQVVRAEVPMAEALTYATELRAMTSGQGYFTQEFSHYEEVPAHVADKITKSREAEAGS